MTRLGAVVGENLDRAELPAVQKLAAHLAGHLGGCAVLYYGSTLRTGDLSAILDFYVLTEGRKQPWLSRTLWPDVSYHEVEIERQIIRAKVATMPLETFVRAARDETADTTIWTRFCQPSRLVFSADQATGDAVRTAVRDAVVSASRFAAALGPVRGSARDYWLALFRETYGAEFRVETQGRGTTILDNAPEWYVQTLPLAWAEAGIGTESDGLLAPAPDFDRRAVVARWRRRRRLGKPLNMARLVKAAWTFEGATRYALWKIERHSGVHIPLTPWRERHPLLAAPGVLFRLWRTARP